jgi:hypothetical protein
MVVNIVFDNGHLAFGYLLLLLDIGSALALLFSSSFLFSASLVILPHHPLFALILSLSLFPLSLPIPSFFRFAFFGRLRALIAVLI